MRYLATYKKKFIAFSNSTPAGVYHNKCYVTSSAFFRISDFHVLQKMETVNCATIYRNVCFVICFNVILDHCFRCFIRVSLFFFRILSYSMYIVSIIMQQLLIPWIYCMLMFFFFINMKVSPLIIVTYFYAHDNKPT
jgi:hypothetical protein